MVTSRSNIFDFSRLYRANDFFFFFSPKLNETVRFSNSRCVKMYYGEFFFSFFFSFFLNLKKEKRIDE